MLGLSQVSQNRKNVMHDGSDDKQGHATRGSGVVVKIGSVLPEVMCGLFDKSIMLTLFVTGYCV
jgi:hypothetical protein